MTRYWDFRAILDVHPETDKRCVAIKVRSNERCKITGYAGRENLGKAGRILDTMDRTEKMVECQTYLLELARCMMCGNPHRVMQNVLEDRVSRWNDTISVYVASISEEEEDEEEDVREDISVTPPPLLEVEPVSVSNSRLVSLQIHRVWNILTFDSREIHLESVLVDHSMLLCQTGLNWQRVQPEFENGMRSATKRP